MSKTNPFFIENSNAEHLMEVTQGISSSRKGYISKGVTIFFSGYLYNELELISSQGVNKLEEAIIRIYHKSAQLCWETLDGCFELVIIEDKIITFFIDKNGYGTLYHNNSSKFFISNSLQEVKRYTNLEADHEAAHFYAAYTYLPGPYTLIKGLKKAEKGKLYQFDGEKFSDTSMQMPAPVFDNSGNRDAIVNTIDQILEQEIQQKAVSSNLGLILNQLSGGTDSSLIQYYLKQQRKDEAFVYSYKDTGRDADYAKDVADELGVQLHRIYPDGKDLHDSMIRGIKAIESPHMFQGECMMEYSFQTLSKTYPKICFFNGMGGDALFVHGRMFKKIVLGRVAAWLIPGKRLPAFIHDEASVIFNALKQEEFTPEFFVAAQGDDRIIRLTGDLKHTAIMEFLIKDLNSRTETLEEKYLRYQLDYYELANQTQFLQKMAMNLDAMMVIPFKNLNLINYMGGIPYHKKSSIKENKVLLKKLLTKYLPKKLVYRKKIGKNIPYKSILNSEPFFSLKEEAARENYLGIDADIQKPVSGLEHIPLVMKLMNYHLWYKQFITS